MIEKSWRITNLLAVLSLLAGSNAFGQDHGRIKKKLPTEVEAARIASNTAMNDSLLQRGDIVATDRGFFVFRGVARDGIANEFVAVPNPLSSNRK